MVGRPGLAPLPRPRAAGPAADGTAARQVPGAALRLGRDTRGVEPPYAPWRRDLLRAEVSGEWLDLGPGDGWAQRALPGGVGLEFDGEQIPAAHGAFDAVWCSHVLQFVPEPLVCLQEVRRVLRPGGRLVVTVPLVRPRIPDPLDRQVRFFTPRSLKRLLRAAGFDARVRLRLGTVTGVATRQ